MKDIVRTTLRGTQFFLPGLLAGTLYITLSAFYPTAASVLLLLFTVLCICYLTGLLLSKK